MPNEQIDKKTTIYLLLRLQGLIITVLWWQMFNLILTRKKRGEGEGKREGKRETDGEIEGQREKDRQTERWRQRGEERERERERE